MSKNHRYLKRKQAKRDAKRRAAIVARPFEACDGEGVRLPDGRCEYHLFRMGDRELYTGRRLETRELLDFILDHPGGSELIGFAFEYDVSNILLDLPADKLAHVLRPPSPAGKGRPWTRLLVTRGKPLIGVMWLPNNYLKVARLVRDPATGRSKAAPGSVRTIQDCFAFFQSSFVTALKASGLVTVEQLDAIEAMKKKRSRFAGIDDEIRRYCASECEQLARLMEDFRAKVLAVEEATGAKLRPRTWNGPGKMAASLFRQIGVPRRIEIEAALPAPLRLLASAAYFGGRFEVSQIGEIQGPCYVADINSAYPAAAQSLPCLAHGEWRKASAGEITRRIWSDTDTETYVAPISFIHPPDQPWCGIPFRAKSPSRLFFPRFGRGVYWSPELRSAKALGADLAAEGPGWIYEPAGCTCRPLGRLADLYEARRRMGKDDKGRPLKLVVNSAYGKLAQRIGEAPYHNPIWAGLITAQTRATINAAIALEPSAVIMVATDGILTRRPLPLDVGDGLGQWDVKEWPEGAFVVKPGLYWRLRQGEATVKSRGISKAYFSPAMAAFESVWRRTADVIRSGAIPAAPFVAVTVQQFCSLRLAAARGDMAQACQWTEEQRRVTFDYHDKRRSLGPAGLDGFALQLATLDGDRDALSHVVMSEEEREGYRQGFITSAMLREAQPDPADHSILGVA